MASESGSYAFSVLTENADATLGRPESERWAQFGEQQADRAADDVGEKKSDQDWVNLTWENLSVTASESKGSSRKILAGLTGFARPAEVLAVMGPSGCGKSTLLDALAGRLAPRMSQSGLILVNGRRQTLAYGTSAYVTQEDVLMATLTVREAMYYSAELLLPEKMSRAQKRERAEMVIMEMGLQDTMDTRIGGRSSKGISGGQRRRVSICTEILTRPKLLFLDEPTSGLDSAASFHVMSRIVDQARLHGGTVIASIHQPSAEVFELFDNLCLLSSGNTIYFGPISLTHEFFAASGFSCPQLRNPSDHFLRTINKDFDMEIGQNGRIINTINTAEAINILMDSYKTSNFSQETQRHVNQISSTELKMVHKGEHAGFITQCLVLTRRSSVNMHRDLGYYWLRLIIYVTLCLSIGSIFFGLGHDYESIQARCSMLSFITGYLTFMSIGGFPSFVEDMKIFRRDRLNGHYGAAAFTIANTLSSSPFLFIISIIPAAVAYSMTGLQKNPQHFIFFTLVLYTCMLLVEGIMMIVASIVPDFLMGIISGAGILGGMMLSGGFFRLPKEMPAPFWRYPAYYIAFHKYASQGLYKNEFIGLTFPSNANGEGSSVISGMEVVRDYWQMEVGYSKWVDLCILVGMVVLYRILFWVTVKLGEEMKPKVENQMTDKLRQMSSLNLDKSTNRINALV